MKIKTAFKESFASKCYKNNIDIKITQMLLGHGDFTITMNIYTHISEEDFFSQVINFENNK